MLEAAGLALPTKVRVHGFLTVNGQKMSKSRGTFILARTYLDHLDPAMLRYYYAAKLSGGIDDLDLNLEEFTAKVNADIVGKVANLASRTARWLEATGLSADLSRRWRPVCPAAAADGAAIAAAYEAGDFARAMRLVMQAADRANAYVDAEQPWKLAKAGPEAAGRLQEVASVAVNLFRQLAVYLAPVLPRLAEQAGDLVGGPIRSWDEAGPAAGRAAGGRLRAAGPAGGAGPGRGRCVAASRTTTSAPEHVPNPRRNDDGTDSPAADRPPPTPPRRSRPSRWPLSARSTTSPRSTCGWPGSWRPRRCPRPASSSSSPSASAGTSDPHRLRRHQGFPRSGQLSWAGWWWWWPTSPRGR